MIPFVTEFLELVNKHGLGPVLLGCGVAACVFGGWLLRGWLSTRNKVALSDAEARKESEKAESGAVTGLTRSIDHLVNKIGDLVSVNNETNTAAAQERQATLVAIRESTARMEGFTQAMGTNTKALQTVSTAVHELNDNNAQLKTDLKEVRLTTVNLQSEVIKALDDRMTPITTLLINLDNHIKTVLSQGQADAQTLTLILAELGKIVSEMVIVSVAVKDIRTLQYDQDERLAQHIEMANTLIKEKPQ